MRRQSHDEESHHRRQLSGFRPRHLRSDDDFMELNDGLDFPRTSDQRVYHLGVRTGEIANRIASHTPFLQLNTKNHLEGSQPVSVRSRWDHGLEHRRLLIFWTHLRCSHCRLNVDFTPSPVSIMAHRFPSSASVWVTQTPTFSYVKHVSVWKETCW